MTKRHWSPFRSVKDVDVIEIVLKPQEVYTDGDKISGQIVLHHHHDFQCDKIQVYFYGKSGDDLDVGTGNDSEYYSTLGCAPVLFKRDIVLHEGPEIIKGLRKFSFAFDFPWVTEPDSTATRFRSDPCFENKPGHRLPPTLVKDSYHGLLSYRCVRYYLQVQAHDPRGIDKRHFSHVVEVRYSPSRCVLDPPPNLSRRTFQFARTSRRLSQCRRAPHHLRKSKAFFVFRVRTALPQQMYPGGPFPLTFAIEHDLDASGIVQPPFMLLHSYRIRLIAVTDHRDDFAQELCRKRVVVGEARGKGAELDLSGLFGTALAPTFKTYDLARHYLLAVHLTVMCAGKKYRVRPETVELVVLSALYRPLDAQSQQPGPEPVLDAAYLRPSSSNLFDRSSQLVSVRDWDAASARDDASMQLLRPVRTTASEVMAEGEYL
ncbi:hypothetical protein MMC13_001921 [Lambiella insularis]|nr:hypothetical protein [Lambiella insularis]